MAIAMLSTTPTLFPYGTCPVDPAFRERYTQEYEGAVSYPLPEELPAHHPLLQRLEGTYALPYSLPPWWQNCVAQVRSDTLRSLLASVSPREFRMGCIDQARWKQFRAMLTETERHHIPTSPKIIGLLPDAAEWVDRFVARGCLTTPDHLTLHISTNPLNFLYMSNGQEWTSCQHWRTGGYNHCLPGNFFDTSVAVVMLLASTHRVFDEAAVLARTTIRVFHDGEQAVIALGRTYHNNETVAFLLLRKLVEMFDQHQLSWGILIDTNTRAYCQQGSLGDDLAERCGQHALSLRSEPSWFPRGWSQPYIDGGDREWERGEVQDHGYYPVSLTAALQVVRPPARASRPMSTLRLPARLAPLGILPLLR